MINPYHTEAQPLIEPPRWVIDEDAQPHGEPPASRLCHDFAQERRTDTGPGAAGSSAISAR